MLSIDEMLEICYNRNLCIEQVFLLYLLSHGSAEKDSPLFKYIRACDKFKPSVMEGLVKRGYLDDFNTKGNSYPEYFMLTKKAEGIFATSNIGEEMWDAYPATFPMYGKGTNFWARTGGDKTHVISEYLKRIGHSTKKHKYVLKQIKHFRDLVERGIVNGLKISDFVKTEFWDSVAEFPDEGNSDGLGRDI